MSGLNRNTSIEEGIACFVRWYREYLNFTNDMECSVLSRIIPIILSGGAGRVYGQFRGACTRNLLWKWLVSRFWHTPSRAALIADEAVIVTNQDHYFLTEKLLKETDRVPNVSYFLEPKGRNTAPPLHWQFIIFKKRMVTMPCASFGGRSFDF